MSKHQHTGSVNSLTVIGNGMMAKGFSKYQGLDLPICIFAAGVSNSNCMQSFEYQRESDLLEQVSAHLLPQFFLVYFSSMTTAVSEKQQDYIFHKRRMEAQVRARTKHLIIRLGQVIGPSDNPHTLTNFLHAQILKGHAFNLWHGQSRNLLDLDDVVDASLAYLKTNPSPSGTVTLANPVNHSVEDLVQAFEALTGNKALATRIDIPTIQLNFDEEPAVRRLLPRIEVDYYLERTLKKYYGSAAPPIRNTP